MVTGVYKDIENEHSGPQTDVGSLLKITKVSVLIDQVVAAMLQKNLNSIEANSPSASAPALSLLLKRFEDEFLREYAALEAEVGEVYTSKLSATEIEDVVAFYESQAGRKFMQASDLLHQQLPRLAQKWSEEAGKVAFTRAIGQADAS